MKKFFIFATALLSYAAINPAHAVDSATVSFYEGKTSSAYDNLLKELYQKETGEAAAKAQKENRSFTPPTFEDWRDKDIGTHPGYPDSYDGSGLR